jgi:DNA-binding NarL/FixJ family response regulator
LNSAGGLDLVVLDRDPAWAESVRTTLDPLGQRVRAATDPAEAMRLVEEASAPLLVVDPSACEEGIDWVRRARAKVETLRVIVLASDSHAETAAAAFAAGASAVIVKTVGGNHLASALALAAAESASDAAKRLGLSDRELELIELVARGYSNAQIARRLWISQPTVKFHLSRIYKKLGVGSRTEAVWAAQARGVLPRGSAAGRPA